MCENAGCSGVSQDSCRSIGAASSVRIRAISA
jgi:hypothetical protein